MDLNKHAPPKTNQFQELITACENDPKRIQNIYENHRLNRNAKFRECITSPGFREWQFDETLEKILEAEQGLTQYLDPRHNLAILARPPQHIRDLIARIQHEIASVAGPCLWLAPSDHLHITALEMMWWNEAHEVDEAVDFLEKTLCLSDLANYTLTHRARLVRPVVSYDATALALSFLPAAGEATNEASSTVDDGYSYHHLRRDLCDITSESGRQFGSRYTVPSAHVTIARFAVPPGAKRNLEVDALCELAPRIIAQIESINQELQSDEWPRFGNPAQGEWLVGQETGLHFNKGRTWYGKGDSVQIGQGFA